MTAKTVLVLLQDGRPVHSFTLKQKAHLGRTPDADLSVLDPTVSTDHARVWRQGERVFLRDLGSTNGTFVNGGRVVGRKQLGDGDTVRLGRDTHIKVKVVTEDGAPAPLALEDIAGGVRRPLDPGENDIDGVVVMVSDRGQVTVDGDEFILGSVRRIGTGRWRLVTRTEGTGPTVRVEYGNATFPYRVEATDAGVNLVHLERPGRRLRVTARAPVALLSALASKLDEDLANGKGNDAGWCDNDEVRRAVWGDSSNRNRLHVAVFRLRKLLEDAGFNPKCVDKERGYTRLNVEDVSL
jgi:pSer/pThr/pTyr-binding forkhead associated (FHA) protein